MSREILRGSEAALGDETLHVLVVRGGRKTNKAK